MNLQPLKTPHLASKQRHVTVVRKLQMQKSPGVKDLSKGKQPNQRTMIKC